MAHLLGLSSALICRKCVSISEMFYREKFGSPVTATPALSPYHSGQHWFFIDEARIFLIHTNGISLVPQFVKLDMICDLGTPKVSYHSTFATFVFTISFTINFLPKIFQCICSSPLLYFVCYSSLRDAIEHAFHFADSSFFCK